MRRAFVALVPPPDAFAQVDAAIAPLRDVVPALRWMPRSQWHVTLQFLGHVEHVDALVVALRDATATIAPFAVRLGGGDAFAKPRAGTVLWVGVEEGAASMTSLAGALTTATVPLGHEPEDRPFRPHLTVARAPRPTDLRAAVAAIDDAGPGPAWTAHEVVLFDSDTRATGAVHTEIARVSLGG
ncbi:MAG: RNA 2',3'-cyclic phosphodiesterase [Acidimicrobiia bacterium]